MTGRERREQLLDVGRRLFAEKGFEGTSVEEIAARAEVSKPVVYEHFGGKEGLYAVVVDREVEGLLGVLTGALASTSHPKIALERTGTEAAPWHVVPADRKWYRNLAVASLLLEALRGLDLAWPPADFDVAEQRRRLDTEDPLA